MTPHLPTTDAEIAAELQRAERVVEEAFPRHNTPRSEEYKAGARAILKYLLAGNPILCPFEPATAEHDAYYAGVDAGKRMYCHLEDK